MLWRLGWCDSGFKHATNTLGDKGGKCRWLLGVPFLKSYCGQVYFFGIVTQHSGVVLPKFGSQLPVFIEPVGKGGQNYKFTVPWGPFLLFDSDSRQEWEVGANMEGYEKLFIFYCSLFNDIHIAKWGWRCGILWFFDLPSVEMLIFSLNQFWSNWSIFPNDKSLLYRVLFLLFRPEND